MGDAAELFRVGAVLGTDGCINTGADVVMDSIGGGLGGVMTLPGADVVVVMVGTSVAGAMVGGCDVDAFISVIDSSLLVFLVHIKTTTPAPIANNATRAHVNTTIRRRIVRFCFFSLSSSVVISCGFLSPFISPTTRFVVLFPPFSSSYVQDGCMDTSNK